MSKPQTSALSNVQRDFWSHKRSGTHQFGNQFAAHPSRLSASDIAYALAGLQAEGKPLSVEDQRSMLDLLAQVEVSEDTLASLSSTFFNYEEVCGDRLKNGVVETPTPIANLMVRLAIEDFFSVPVDRVDPARIKELTWFDPCVGAGAFPVAILGAYMNLAKEIKSVEDLPQIAINDISAAGVFLTFCAINLLLQETAITLAEYLNSGRLRYSIADVLSSHGEASDLIKQNTKYDIVIGNPPYVRASRLDSSYRQFLKSNFPKSYYGSADLYTYFIASGISSLKDRGVLVFISPVSFLRTKSGSSIRKVIAQSCAVKTLMDMDETKIFEAADVHSSIYSLQKNTLQKETVAYEHITSLSRINELQGGLNTLNTALISFPKNKSWTVHKTGNSFAFLDSIERNSIPLSELGINVYSGIRAGHTKAFLLEEREVSNFSSEVREGWIKPIILPAHIRRWRGANKINYFIFTPHHGEVPPAAILHHLNLYKEKLISRPEVGGQSDWYRLRTCSYYNKMLSRKIVFPDLSAKQRFSLCEEGILIPDGAYFLDSEDLALLGILNSELARKYFVHRCSSVGNLEAKGRFRFKKNYIKDFPLPKNFRKSIELRQEIEIIVKKVLAEGESLEASLELNNRVNDLYRL